MNFAPSDRIQPLLDQARAFLHQRVVPHELKLQQEGFYVHEQLLDGLRAEVKALGLWAPQLPEALGGLGLTLVEHGLFSEVLGQTPYGHYVFGCQAPDAGNIEVLHAHATPAQRERFLEPLVAGRTRSCFAMTEPDSPGSNPTQLHCRAYRDEDHFVLNGRKWFATGADGAAFAVVMAVTDPEAPPHQRASMILVPTDTPGFVHVRNIAIMGHAGDGWASHAELRFEDCRVPAANLLGRQGAGFAIAQERLGPGRIHHCMRWLGICERAFDLMARRAVSRRIEGDTTLAKRDLVKAWLAECRARIDAARWLVLHTAWRIDREGFEATREPVSLIKFHVADVLDTVVDRAIQVHGALGITDDTILSYFYAHERGARIYDGPDEVHKLAAARQILRRYQP